MEQIKVGDYISILPNYDSNYASLISTINLRGANKVIYVADQNDAAVFNGYVLIETDAGYCANYLFGLIDKSILTNARIASTYSDLYTRSIRCCWVRIAHIKLIKCLETKIENSNKTETKVELISQQEKDRKFFFSDLEKQHECINSGLKYL